ncbi:MAG TPA: DegT/DnrJ/EryC1/StrS family aminotransferase, partial [Streptosporangiaceae bacterium]
AAGRRARALAVNGGTPVRTRPFPSWPYQDEAERRGLVRALESGAWGGRIGRGDGEAARFEAEFAAHHDAPAALTVTNGTHALQLALEVAGVGPGDEVLMPALTPIPTANAARQCGAVPVPVDVEPGTYCIDPEQLDAARTGRTAAVIAVHLGGHVADMDRIGAWAAGAGLPVIQDAAHAHGTRWRGRGIGALGSIATFSFMQTKVMTAGEGGALLLPDPATFAEAFARHCLGRAPDASPAIFRTASSNYRLGEFAAAVLRAQLARLPGQIRHRELRRRRLDELLAPIAGITPQARDPRCTVHSHYMTPLVLDPEPYGAVSRDGVVRALRAEGIPAYAMFPPIYRLPAFWDGPPPGADPDDGRTAGTEEELAAACPVAERLAGRGIFLRHEVLLGDDRDIDDIACAIGKVLGALGSERSSFT